MATDRAMALRRASEAYERSRVWHAIQLAAPLLALAVVAPLLGATPATSALAGGAAVVLATLMWWRGRDAGRAVYPGVAAGLVPLALALSARAYGHVCTASGCVSLCVPACTAGGLVAGLLIARAGRAQRRPLVFYGSAATLALLVGSLGCSCVGASGVLGLLLGLALTVGPTALVRRSHAPR